MNTNINTLIVDVQELLKKRGWFDEPMAEAFSRSVAGRLQAQYGENTRKPALRLSQMGPRCPRALWYSICRPEMAEPLPAWAEVKYSFGHIIEALAICYAKASGHLVTGEQDELVYEGIVGHRDCVIDGCIVDVKSAASMSFNKFRSGTFEDTFGYLDQLDGYVLAAADDPLVTVKNKGYLFVIDKQLGKMTLYEHTVTPQRAETLKQRVAEYKQTVGQPVAPACKCGTITDGSSGNVKLDVKAGYSPFKHCCFPNLRTFLYSTGPVHFSKVLKRPYNHREGKPLPELGKDGQFIY